MSDLAEPPKDPKTGLQEWLLARGMKLPSYVLLSREGPPPRPGLRHRRLRASAMTAGAPRAASVSPSGWLPPTCWPSCSGERGHRPQPVRVRRHSRRTERRQVDPLEPAGRRQAVDRHPEGADHAVPRAGHCRSRPGPDPAGGHAGHLPPAPAARPRHGGGGLEGGGGRRPADAPGRRPGRPDRRGARHRRGTARRRARGGRAGCCSTRST